MPINSDNYATREAAERLQKAGIVMETDFQWVYAQHIPLKGADKSWKIFDRFSLMVIEMTQYKPLCVLPAPSLAEITRQFPDGDDLIATVAAWIMSITGMPANDTEIKRVMAAIIKDINRAIDLKIWLEGRK